jgi:hypothetical protein
MSEARTRLAALAQALRSGLEWRVLTIFTLGMLLPTLVAVAPAWQLLGSALDHSPRVPDIARRFDILAFEDVAVLFRRDGPALAGAGAAATVVALGLYPLLTGMMLSVANGVRAPRATELVQNGVAWYGRALRSWLVSAIPWGVAGGLTAVAFKVARGSVDRAVLESQANWASRSATLVAVLLFVLAHATVEAGRAELAADERRRSAFRAWIAGLRHIVERPVALFGSYLGVTLASLLVASALALLRIRVVGSTGPTFWLGVVLTQLAVAAIGWGKASRIMALAALARSSRSDETRDDV